MRQLNLLALLMMMISGCSSISHELQPHRLWRWNYYEPPGRTDDALFSIDDPLPQPVEPTAPVRNDGHE